MLDGQRNALTVADVQGRETLFGVSAGHPYLIQGHQNPAAKSADSDGLAQWRRR
ncbi:MAG: hypothetical protein H6975_02290 [Gammaproteobacteria bacterium]|nr:hypothetical protein [Gammaproteobacteria bacterium]